VRRGSVQSTGPGVHAGQGPGAMSRSDFPRLLIETRTHIHSARDRIVAAQKRGFAVA
jgi:hypothetical protein